MTLSNPLPFVDPLSLVFFQEIPFEDVPHLNLLFFSHILVSFVLIIDATRVCTTTLLMPGPASYLIRPLLL